MRQLESEQRPATVLYLVYHNLASLSDVNPPQARAQIIHDLSEPVIDSASLHRKIIHRPTDTNSSMMVLFTGRASSPRHSLQAVEAAFDMRSAFSQINDQRRQQGLIAVRYGIGIATGEVYLGKPDRTGQTVIGDPAKIAQRIAMLTEDFGALVMINETTYQRIRDKVEVGSDSHMITVKNTRSETAVYTITDLKKLQ